MRIAARNSALLFVLGLLVLASLALTLSAATSQADMWASAVTAFVTDPHFLRVGPASKIRQRFKPLVPSPVLDLNQDNGYGSNPAMGILRIDIVLLGSDKRGTAGAESVDLVMPLKDQEGHELYPILKSRLMKALNKRPWKLSSSYTGQHWRKGDSAFGISLGVDTVQNPGWAQLTSPGPYVLLTAGLEEGCCEDN